MSLYTRKCLNCIELKDNDVLSLSPDGWESGGGQQGRYPGGNLFKST